MRTIDADAFDKFLENAEAEAHRIQRYVFASALNTIRGNLREFPTAETMVRCKDCQWLADIKDVDTGEMYHACGVLGIDVPDGFACNQGKRKGADE